MPQKILVVDDESEIVDLLDLRLTKLGYNIITASDGMEGLEKARKEAPDLIILDVMMPRLDGFNVCRMLKFDEKFKRIPIIMFTARSQETDKRLGGEVGADAYIPKPFEPEQLLSEIKRLLKKDK